MTADGSASEPVGFGQNRREFIQALSGAIGVALVADATALTDLAESAKGSGKLPSGYVFERLFTVGGKKAGFDDVEEIHPGVILTDGGDLIFHASRATGEHVVYRSRLSKARRARATRPQAIVATGQALDAGTVVERVSVGDANAGGTFAFVVRGTDGFRSIWAARRGKAPQLVLARGATAPGGGTYSGGFGDIDLEDDGALMFTARFTDHGEASQGLFYVPRNKKRPGKLLLQTGQRLPDSKSLITGFGLIERRGRYFIQQVYGRQFSHLARQDFKTEPSGFVTGVVSQGHRGARLLLGSKELRAEKRVLNADAFVGPRVHSDGTAGTVSHRGGGHLTLHRHQRSARRATKLSSTGSRTDHGAPVETISAPVFGAGGILYYRTISKRAMEIYAVDDRERRRIIASGDRVNGERVKAFNFGWHTDQADKNGRLAFQATLADGRTTIIVGTPV